MNSMKNNATQLEGGTYEIIQNRLQKHKNDLVQRLQTLNNNRKDVFGAVETKLIANDRISTENTCTARDIVSFGNISLFGYNVHFGLRSEIKLKDVFSVYKFQENRFQEQDLSFINQESFVSDFKNLYKYYRNTFFTKFMLTEQYLYMVFQIGDKLDGKELEFVAGIPRGGLIPAVMISHAFDVKYISYSSAKTLPGDLRSKTIVLTIFQIPVKLWQKLIN